MNIFVNLEIFKFKSRFKPPTNKTKTNTIQTFPEKTMKVRQTEAKVKMQSITSYLCRECRAGAPLAQRITPVLLLLLLSLSLSFPTASGNYGNHNINYDMEKRRSSIRDQKKSWQLGKNSYGFSFENNRASGSTGGRTITSDTTNNSNSNSVHRLLKAGRSRARNNNNNKPPRNNNNNNNNSSNDGSSDNEPYSRNKRKSWFFGGRRRKCKPGQTWRKRQSYYGYYRGNRRRGKGPYYWDRGICVDKETKKPPIAPRPKKSQKPSFAPRPEPKPTRDPTTQPPRPTPSPTNNPTKANQPIPKPVRTPTASPLLPTPNPTEQTPEPTQSPTQSPTEAPTQSPTDSPTESPPEACSANPKCVADGYFGDCCPSPDGIYLDCCANAPPAPKPTEEATPAPTEGTPTVLPTVPTPSPTSLPTNIRCANRTRLEQLFSLLHPISPEIDILDQENPQGEAFTWLLFNDPLSITPCTYPTVEQRYSLAVLYFATEGPTWTSDTGWLSGTIECDWFGVTCNEQDEVIAVSLGK